MNKVLFTHQYLSEENRPYIYSAVIHFAILIIVIAMSYLTDFGSGASRIKITRSESTVRVDTVAMPQRTLKELKSIRVDTKPEEVELVDSREKLAIEDVRNDPFYKQKRKKNFQELLKKMSKKKVKKTRQKKQKKPRRLSKKSRSRLQQLILEGNKVSKGTKVADAGVADSSPELASYMDAIASEVRVYWKLPSYLLELDLNCRVRIFVNGAGKLMKVKIFESSGNDEYDKRAIEATQKASPFNVVPKSIINDARSGVMLLGFPL